MVTDTTPTANQIRNRARRLVPLVGDQAYSYQAAMRLGMSEGDVSAAALFLRSAMVDYMTAHPARPMNDDMPGLPSPIQSAGMLLAALGFQPVGLTESETAHGFKALDSYEFQRMAVERSGP